MVKTDIINDITNHGPYQIEHRCTDRNKEDKLATAVIGDRKTPICWSKSEFLKEMQKSNISLEELVLGTAIHEHAHRLGYPEEIAYQWGSLLGKEAFLLIMKNKMGWLRSEASFALSDELTQNIISSLSAPPSRGPDISTSKLKSLKTVSFGVSFGINSNAEFWKASELKEMRAAEQVMTEAINEVYDKCIKERSGVIEGIYLEKHYCDEGKNMGAAVKWYCVAEVYGKCVFNKYGLSRKNTLFSFFDSEWSQDDARKAEEFKRQFSSGYEFDSFFRTQD